jgi:NTE family protein
MKKLVVLLLFLAFVPKVFTQNDDINSETRPKIGLVLSGGSAKGLAHVGVIKVLEEMGIRPDYIGGTSMGSIVGALYAIGYNVDSLESIATNTDWSRLLGDEISRRDLALEEKEDADRFFVSVPIKEDGIKIPSGVINGQNIENRFNTLFAPVHDKRDFDDFQIPFVCIATDIETGEEIVFREGYLPKVIRASISIPSLLDPIEINDRLLVDGGLINNFPVDRVKEMGADILIGVDVGFTYYKKDELNSIFRILEQSVFFYGDEKNRRNKEMCDVLIKPEFGEFSSTSFTEADTLIAIGEAAARKAMPQLKKLIDSLNIETNKPLPPLNTPVKDSLVLTEIRIRGLSKVSDQLVTGKLQLEILDKVTPRDLERAMERLYSSLYFEKVSYELFDRGEGVGIIIDIVEAKGGQFRLGMHYDTNYRSAILLNATFRNVILDGSKISTSFSLGENPYFEASIYKDNGWKPGFGMRFNSSKLDVYVYDEGRRISSLAYNETKLQLYTQSVFWNFYALGAGLEYENVKLRPKIDPILGFETTDEEYLNYFGFIKMDSYDNGYYPSIGVKVDARLKFITREYENAILFAVGRISKATPVSEKLTLINHLYAGIVDGDSIPYQYNFYTGGSNPTTRNGLLPFAGLDYMEIVDRNALIYAADLQYQLFPNIYIVSEFNIGNLRSSFKDLFTTDQIISGLGLTLGYDSFIGPIEISAQKRIGEAGLLGFINIGFWF